MSNTSFLAWGLKVKYGRWITVAATAVALVLPMAIPAQAHMVVRGDYNDSASPLDVRAAAFMHTSDFYVGGIETYDVFRNGMLGAKGDLYVDIDSVGTREADYYVAMSMHNGSLKARVYRYSNNTSYLIGRGQAWRPNTRIVMFAFRRSVIRRTSGYIRFYGSSRFQRGVDEYGTVDNWWDRTPWKTHNF